ncbi:hypothetical protein [uncultured Tateyamaria sp.]|uniref:hypothetical protein n=1 Tax=uncultured Tateyamaria sp. TaxID=455651 RepID=UPI002610FA5C|nr:hypothetical protein [uncultured Tateyamaria sp.]
MTHQTEMDDWQGKGVSPEQAAKIELAVLKACELETTGIFHRDLTEGCASVGWGPFDPMTLWTIAVHADVYPIGYTPREIEASDGPLLFSQPGFALEHSTLGLFWNDRDLINLAKKRAIQPGQPHRPTGRRPGLRPYRGDW